MNRDEPAPPVSAPEPPAHLDERRRAKFTELAGLRWIDAEAQIKRKGPIVKTEAGNIQSAARISPSPTAATGSWRSWRASSA